MKTFATALFLLVFSVLSYSQKKYNQGFYIDENESKVDCKMRYYRGSASMFQQSSCFIKIIDSTGKKVKLTPEDIKTFKIESDSFTIARNFVYYPLIGSLEKDFVKILQCGKINLYHHISSGVNGSGMSYDINTFVVSKNSREFFGIYNKKVFKRDFIKLVSDDFEVLKFIESMDKIRWESYLPVIVTLYNNNWLESGMGSF